MDPEVVTLGVWHDLSIMLRFLWAYLLFIIGVAFNFLIAHALIPSLVNSGQLPPRIARLRPLFYLGALSLLVVAIAFLVLSILGFDVTQKVWRRWWI